MSLFISFDTLTCTNISGNLPEFSGLPPLLRVIQILHPTCSPCRSCPFYCIILQKKKKKMKEIPSSEVISNVRPLETITHQSPVSFPDTVRIPHLNREIKRPRSVSGFSHTAVLNGSREVYGEDKVKSVPAPLRFHTDSLSLSSSTLMSNECQIVGGDKNALSK